jgi:hypothetical protein
MCASGREEETRGWVKRIGRGFGKVGGGGG